jgi:hypothetical protein
MRTEPFVKRWLENQKSLTKVSIEEPYHEAYYYECFKAVGKKDHANVYTCAVVPLDMSTAPTDVKV